MERRGNNTSPAQRLYNLKKSRECLEGLLRANFQEGAQLVTLTYGAGAVPSNKMADIQLTNWLQRAREKRGQRLRYIRATERDSTGNSYPIHRVVLALSGASAASLTALWECGPVEIEPVQGDRLGELAGLLMAQALEAGRTAVPCGHTWAPSLGLIRPEKNGE